MVLPHHHHTEEDMQRITEKFPTPENIAAVADAMKQLGDPTRLRIFWLLCHTEECVLDIAALMQMSSPAVAHHLRLLKEAQLVTTRRSGKEVYYTAANTPMAKTLHHVVESLARITCPENKPQQ